MKHCYLKLFSFIMLVAVLEELLKEKEPIPVVLRSKAKFCGSSIAEVADSNRAEGMEFRLLCLLWVVEVAVSVTRRALFHRSPTGCVCV